jgi:hypothetical protein
MAANLTNQVRNITEVTTSVTSLVAPSFIIRWSSARKAA